MIRDGIDLLCREIAAEPGESARSFIIIEFDLNRTEDLSI